MKKFLLSIVAAIMAVGAWAQTCYGDSIPVPRYLTDMRLNLETGTFRFVDNFQTSMAIDRQYFVSVYARHHDECRFSILSGSRAYGYGLDPNGWDGFCIWSLHAITSNATIWAEDSYGGVQTVDLTQQINRALEKGCLEIIIFVNPKYVTRDEISGVTTYNSYYYPDEPTTLISGGAHAYNYYLINYYECDLPKVKTFELTTPASTVKYGENIELNCAVQAAGQARVVFSESDQPDGDQRVIYDYTLSASEAGAGKVVSYHKSFIDDDMPATRYYHVALWLPDGKAGELSTSLNFQYPLTINSGTPAYYSPGEQITVPKSDCGAYSVRTVNNIPVNLEDLGDNYRLTMPSCAVWLNEKPTQYTVQFRDYDNTVLKTEKVACGNDATPPTPPTHAGMTFTEWDKPYTNIHASQVIRATYSVDGVEAKLSLNDLDFVIQGESRTFNIYVNTHSNIAARAWLQAAWLDDESDELDFSGDLDKVDFSAAEAAVGTTKTIEKTVLPTGSLNFGHRARYFRLHVRVNGSSNDIYSNIIRIDTYYEIAVDNRVDELNAYVALADGQTYFHYQDNKIYARPLDTIHAFDYDALACPLKYQLSPTPDGGIEAGDYWVVVPRGYGEGTLTITRHKHQVLFYCEGHFDGYWRTVYGDGVYEPQEVSCGGAATPPDVVAEVPEGKLFRGWKARGEYADDAYTCVKQDMAFDALLEDEPQSIEFIPVPQDKARKYMIHGQIYIALPDGKVFDLRGLRVR